jgi:hypothetical protein
MLDHDPLSDSHGGPEPWLPERANQILADRAWEIVFKQTKATLLDRLPEHASVWTGLSESDLLLEISDPDERNKIHLVHGANFTMDGEPKFILLEPDDSSTILQKLSPRLRVEAARTMVWDYVIDTLRNRIRALERNAEDREEDEDEKSTFGNSLDALSAWEEHMQSQESEDDEFKEDDDEYEQTDLEEDEGEIIVDVMKKAEFDSMCEEIGNECEDLRRLYAAIVNGEVSYPE